MPYATYRFNKIIAAETIRFIVTVAIVVYKGLKLVVYRMLTAIADYIFNHMETARQSEEDMWVDSYEVCTFLKISEKTLQRLRVSGTIAYSNIRGRYFYKVSEIRRMLEERLIRSNKENIDNLITNHQLYAKERGNLRKNK